MQVLFSKIFLARSVPVSKAAKSTTQACRQATQSAGLSYKRKSAGGSTKVPPARILYAFFHTAGVSSISIGYSSRRPASISNIRIYLVTGCIKPKLQVGPTLERPGPMLLNVQATEVNTVSRSRFSKSVIAITDTENSSM